VDFEVFKVQDVELRTAQSRENDGGSAIAFVNTQLFQARNLRGRQAGKRMAEVAEPVQIEAGQFIASAAKEALETILLFIHFQCFRTTKGDDGPERRSVQDDAPPGNTDCRQANEATRVRLQAQ